MNLSDSLTRLLIEAVECVQESQPSDNLTMLQVEVIESTSMGSTKSQMVVLEG